MMARRADRRIVFVMRQLCLKIYYYVKYEDNLETAILNSGMSPTRDRVALLDVLRGIALVGILAVNMEYYSQTLYEGWEQPLWSDTLSLAVRWLVTVLFQMKAYLLFALLFGYGMGMQARKVGPIGKAVPARKAEPDTSGQLQARHIRRMGMLCVFGVLHAVMFFSGDILVTYALLGLLTILFWQQSNRRLLTTSVAIYLASVMLALLLMVLLAELSAVVVQVAGIKEIYANGSVTEVIQQRLQDLYSAFPFVLLHQGPMAMALLLAGIVMARYELLSRPQKHRRLLIRLSHRGLLPGVAGSILAASLQFATEPDSAVSAIGYLLELLSAPAACVGFVAFMAGRRVDGDTFVWQLLSASGRMSVTVYIAQSLIASFVFTSYGFGLIGCVGPVVGLVLTVVMSALLAVFSWMWLRRFRFGPLEWLLRSVTYGRLQVFSR